MKAPTTALDPEMAEGIRNLIAANLDHIDPATGIISEQRLKNLVFLAKCRVIARMAAAQQDGIQAA